MIWLLDTNVLVYARNGKASVVARLDQAWEQGDVVTSLLAVGELIYGAEKSVRREENLAAVEQQIAMLASSPRCAARSATALATVTASDLLHLRSREHRA